MAIGGRGQAAAVFRRKCPGSLRRWGLGYTMLPGQLRSRGEAQGCESDCLVETRSTRKLGAASQDQAGGTVLSHGRLLICCTLSPGARQCVGLCKMDREKRQTEQ